MASGNGRSFEFRGPCYAFRFNADMDTFSVLDAAGREVVCGAAQPLVAISRTDGTTAAAAGTVVTAAVAAGPCPTLTVRYATMRASAGEGAVADCADTGGGTATRATADHDAVCVTMTWRFEPGGFWIEPLTVSAPGGILESISYFAADCDGKAVPTLCSGYLVQPGICASPTVSPVVAADANLTMRTWIGRGCSSDRTVTHAQWGLPVHYFCGMSTTVRPNQRAALTTHLTGAFCMGMADLPPADVTLHIHEGRFGPVLEYAGRRWGAEPSTGEFEAGSRWFVCVAEDYRSAISGYYGSLVDAKIVAVADPSPAKREVMSLTQFNTWGAQASGGCQFDDFTEHALEAIYGQLQDSGMNTGCFVIDDKWEGSYGLLEHSVDRFPNFEETLRRIRRDGFRIGLWAAFLRCENPALLGLGPEHMLRGIDGHPWRISGRDGAYFLFDVSQPIVRRKLAEQARAFARRYRPDLVKFDFGYEMPDLALAATADLSLAGERMLTTGLHTVVEAMREVLPDLVVMYYSLSPLLGDYLDLHSLDDVWLAGEEYQLEVNRRAFFSGLLGELGMPSYGSGGYDWPSLPDIWFDTICAGSLGSLASFSGDPIDSRPFPAAIAKFNGLRHLIRASGPFRIEALRYPKVASSTAARSSSWARWEGDDAVLVALRPRHFDNRAGVTEFRDLVRTDAAVVVGSLTERDLASTGRLAVVPFGDGTVRVRRAVPADAAATGEIRAVVHVFGGGSLPATATMHGDWLFVGVAERCGDGRDVEWIEITFA